MNLIELLRENHFIDTDYIEGKDDGNEINYDLVDDLVYFMNNNDKVYRNQLYPVVVKCVAALKSKKSFNSAIFKSAVINSYNEYTREYPIKELPDELDTKILVKVCKQLKADILEHYQEEEKPPNSIPSIKETKKVITKKFSLLEAVYATNIGFAEMFKFVDKVGFHSPKHKQFEKWMNNPDTIHLGVFLLEQALETRLQGEFFERLRAKAQEDISSNPSLKDKFLELEVSLSEAKTQLKNSVKDATPGMHSYSHLDNNNHPYLSYRFGVALARSPASNLPQEGPLGSKLVMIDYSDGDKEIRKSAEKSFGVKSSSCTTAGSKELPSTNSKSPVAKRNKNKYGV
jgi:hypothetical protein